MSRYDSPDYAGAFPGGAFDANADAMTAPGTEPAAPADRFRRQVPPYDPMTKPLIVSPIGSTYGATAVPVTGDDTEVPAQVGQYSPGGFRPWTDEDTGHSGAGQGRVTGPGNPNADDGRHPFAAGRGARELGGRRD